MSNNQNNCMNQLFIDHIGVCHIYFLSNIIIITQKIYFDPQATSSSDVIT